MIGADFAVRRLGPDDCRSNTAFLQARPVLSVSAPPLITVVPVGSPFRMLDMSLVERDLYGKALQEEALFLERVRR